MGLQRRRINIELINRPNLKLVCINIRLGYVQPAVHFVFDEIQQKLNNSLPWPFVGQFIHFFIVLYFMGVFSKKRHGIHVSLHQFQNYKKFNGASFLQSRIYSRCSRVTFLYKFCELNGFYIKNRFLRSRLNNFLWYKSNLIFIFFLFFSDNKRWFFVMIAKS